MEKKFEPEKYGMMFCPNCEGQGRIFSSDDVKVCQTCGGFGFIIRTGRRTYTASRTVPLSLQRW